MQEFLSFIKEKALGVFLVLSRQNNEQDISPIYARVSLIYYINK